MEPIESWFCCLNPTERGVLIATWDSILASLGVGVPRSVWDLFWLPFSYTGAARRLAFIAIYGLEIATIPIDGLPIEVVRPRLDFALTWVAWGLYLETPAAACVDGCKQSKLPWQD